MDATTHDLGQFEGFNFRSQCAIAKLLTAEEVLEWDHDKNGEAEFWPDGSNFFVSKLLPRSSCCADEIREVARIFEELEGSEVDLVKAVYLSSQNGLPLKDIDRRAIDDTCLYVFGPGYLIDLDKEAAYDLFETFWPEAHKTWETGNVPGLHFDVRDFLDHFSTMELRVAEGQAYLVIDTE